MSKEFKRMIELAGLPTPEITTEENITESLNENFVGIPAINNVFEREKTDYELAFEHFTKGTSILEDYDKSSQEMEEESLHQEESEELEEGNGLRVSPDNAVAYLENTLRSVWNRGVGKNDIDFQSMAQSIAQDLGLIEDLEEGNDDLYTAKRFYKRTDNPRINILANLNAVNDIMMDMLETDIKKVYGPDERDDIYREYMKFVNAVKNLVK